MNAMIAENTMKEHYQIAYDAKNCGYQVQHMRIEPRRVYTFWRNYATYLEALQAAAEIATERCPLLAWGYAVRGMQDAATLHKANVLEEEYAAAMDMGRRYEATGDAGVFFHARYR
jgi:hypothetical protein